jgi:hypothetical protein
VRLLCLIPSLCVSVLSSYVCEYMEVGASHDARTSHTNKTFLNKSGPWCPFRETALYIMQSFENQSWGFRWLHKREIQFIMFIFRYLICVKMLHSLI